MQTGMRVPWRNTSLKGTEEETTALRSALQETPQTYTEPEEVQGCVAIGLSCPPAVQKTPTVCGTASPEACVSVGMGSDKKAGVKRMLSGLEHGSYMGVMQGQEETSLHVTHLAGDLQNNENLLKSTIESVNSGLKEKFQQMMQQDEVLAASQDISVEIFT